MRTQAVLTITLPFWYIRQTRSGTQAVRDWSAKPSLVGSTPIHSLMQRAVFLQDSPLFFHAVEAKLRCDYIYGLVRKGRSFFYVTALREPQGPRGSHSYLGNNSCTPAQAASTPQPHKAAVGSGSK